MVEKNYKCNFEKILMNELRAVFFGSAELLWQNFLEFRNEF